MTPLHEITSKIIVQTIELSEQAHDLIIEVLSENNDSVTAAYSLCLSSRYNQLNKSQKIKLIYIVLNDKKSKIRLLKNYKYISKCRCYEFDIIINNFEPELLMEIFKRYPKDYLDGLINRHKKNKKFISIITLLKMNN